MHKHELLALAALAIDHSPKLAAIRIDDEQQAAAVSVLGWFLARFECANPGVSEWHVMAFDSIA